MEYSPGRSARSPGGGSIDGGAGAYTSIASVLSRLRSSGGSGRDTTDAGVIDGRDGCLTAGRVAAPWLAGGRAVGVRGVAGSGGIESPVRDAGAPSLGTVASAGIAEGTASSTEVSRDVRVRELLSSSYGRIWISGDESALVGMCGLARAGIGGGVAARVG